MKYRAIRLHSLEEEFEAAFGYRELSDEDWILPEETREDVNPELKPPTPPAVKASCCRCHKEPRRGRSHYCQICGNAMQREYERRKKARYRERLQERVAS